MAKDYTPIILASSSPRRQELLRLIVPEFQVVPPKVEEDAVAEPQDLLRLAKKKAEAVAARYPEALVIAADTGVFRDGRAYGKPDDLAEAKRFLAALSGGWHSVFTGLVVRWGSLFRESLVETRVLFRPLSEEEILWYLRSEEVLDKAGAYAIQGRAAVFVERIEGDFYNVMGLPLCALWRILWELGWRPKG
ncbi:septum formation protein Maf [Candidatus Bipolaricaulota bacterium]|nr:septum formation protein Maf [Candidatus Bipolaricaulota bacterium]